MAVPSSKLFKTNIEAELFVFTYNEYCVKNVQIWSYFWSECVKMRTRNSSVFGHFSRSGLGIRRSIVLTFSFMTSIKSISKKQHLEKWWSTFWYGLNLGKKMSICAFWKKCRNKRLYLRGFTIPLLFKLVCINM